MSSGAPPPEFLGGRPALLRRVLWSRREVLGADLEAFLDPKGGRTHDPRLMGDLPEAVALVQSAITAGRRVAVFGDYDADGVTATAILMRGLRAVGADVIAHIPHRINDGYGLNPEGLAELDRQGAGLVISCDCGTNSVDVIAGRPAGQVLVVTDHHLPAAEIARPDALLNPHRPGDEYPFKELSGAGVAFKLIQGLGGSPAFAGRLTEETVEGLLQLVAVGAVADVVSLLGENRELVRRGLEAIGRAPLPGIAALIETGQVRLPVDTRTIGFQLAPRINAAGRMDDARLALDLLLAESMDEALPLAEHLERHNLARREATEKAVAEAEAMLEGLPDPAAIVLASEEWALGLVGLVAGRLAEAHHAPAFILNRGAEECRGSARWVHGFNVVEALDSCAAHLTRYGGHVAAAGFACRSQSFEALAEGLRAHAERLRPEGGWSRLLPIDVEVRLSELTPQSLADLAVLEPHGEGNPPPRFCCRGVVVKAANAFGAGGAHLRLYLGQDDLVVEAVAWNRGPYVEYYQRAWRSGQQLDVVFSAASREWEGAVTVQLELEDVQKAGWTTPAAGASLASVTPVAS
jgi:single-stranded-DNA-specific exonuclease